jgi:hypothetical protein
MVLEVNYPHQRAALVLHQPDIRASSIPARREIDDALVLAIQFGVPFTRPVRGRAVPPRVPGSIGWRHGVGDVRHAFRAEADRLRAESPCCAKP